MVACLPGSRAGEVAHLGPVFADVLRRLLASDDKVTVLVPAASDARLKQIESLMPIEDIRFQVFEGDSRLAMVASDSVLCASGTTTLEAMLIGRPMVIGYRMAWLSWQILGRMVNTPHVGLPNILCDYPVVPELLQHDATEENLYRALQSLGSAANASARCLRRLRCYWSRLRRSCDALCTSWSRRPNESVAGRLVAGVDEVGRGPLAGDVVAAAVILAPVFPEAAIPSA